MLSIAAASIALSPLHPALADYMRVSTGRWSSAAQSAADSRYDIVLARVVRIWPERTDGLWLYQEQAITGGAGPGPWPGVDRPYFQRVGHVRRMPDGRLRRDNYALREPARFVGLGRRAGVPFLNRADLGPAGCHNLIERVGAGHFVARTDDCRNGYKGAETMLGLAVTTPRTVVSWDRGFARDGRQVWGPTDGGYVFDKISVPEARTRPRPRAR